MHALSAKPCGCDPGWRWFCEEHRGERDAAVILAALEAELQLYLRTGMRVSEGRLALWLRDIREAKAEKGSQS